MIDEQLFDIVFDIDFQMRIETCVDILGIYAHKSGVLKVRFIYPFEQ